MMVDFRRMTLTLDTFSFIELCLSMTFVPQSYQCKSKDFGEYSFDLFITNVHGLQAKIKEWKRIYSEKPPMIYRDDHLISLTH